MRALLPFFSGLWRDMSCKVSPIVKFEIFRLSVNTLIADDKYPVRDCENIQFSIQMQLCQKRNTFSQYFVLLGEFTANFKRFEKKMIVIANVLPILQTVEDLVGPLSKKRHFRTSFYSQHVKLSQTLLKPTWDHFYHISSSLWGEMICKVSPLVKFQILGVLVNTLTANLKYPVWNCEKLSSPIQTILSKKQKTFSQFFIPFLEFPANFKHLQKKEGCHS